MKADVSAMLAVLLAALMPAVLVACQQPEQPEQPENGGTTTEQGATVERTGAWANATYVSDTVLGEGAKAVKVKVVADGQAITLTIKTDKTTLREAMDEHGLLAGEDGAYGLYIESVNGIVVKYEDGGYWWGISKAGVTTPTGVEGITVADGEQYELTKTNAY